MKPKLLVLAGVGVLGALIQTASAYTWDQKTVFTFSGPIEVPDQVLPAGNVCIQAGQLIGGSKHFPGVQQG